MRTWLQNAHMITKHADEYKTLTWLQNAHMITKYADDYKTCT